MNDDRRYWVGVAERLATPVLEALGRLLMGLAPWLELGPGTDAERLLRALRRTGAPVGRRRHRPRLARPPLNFSEGQQPLVDAAFLALALLRAPRELWEKLDARVQGNLVAALRETRRFIPAKSNWVFFASTVEAALRRRVGRSRTGPGRFRPWPPWRWPGPCPWNCRPRRCGAR